MSYAPYLISHVSCLVSPLCLSGFVSWCLVNQLYILTYEIGKLIVSIYLFYIYRVGWMEV
jgi:cytochrome c oxidase subunit IV